MADLFVYFLILATLFLPGITFSSAIPSLYLENFLLVGVGLWLILSGRYRWRELMYPRHLNTFSLPYSLLLFYALLLTWLMLPFTESKRFIAYNIAISAGKLKPLLMLMVLFALLKNRQSVRKVGSLFIIIIFLEVGLMFCQSRDLFGVNQWLSPLYRGKELHGAMARGERVFGTMGNVNTMGTMMAVFGTLAYARAIFGPGTLFRMVSAGGAGLALVSCIWLNRSRQGTICLLAGVFAVQLVSMLRTGKRTWAVIMFFIAGAGLIVLIGALGENPELAERFGIFLGEKSLLEEGSFSVRINSLPYFWEINGPWLALGRGVGVRPYFWDSGYMDTLESVGLFGMLMLLMMHIYPALHAWRFMRGRERTEEVWLYAGCIGLAPALLLVPVVNTTWTDPKVMTVIVMAYAVTLGAMRFAEQPYPESQPEWELPAVHGPGVYYVPQPQIGPR